MVKAAIVIFAIVCFIALANAWTLNVVNKVNPCAGRNYPTIKLFLANNVQFDVPQGTSHSVDGGLIGSLGLGIQENGEYCRCCGNEPPCLNPDNAGMQLVVHQGSCYNIQLNNPFYCGAHPPNAKNIVDVSPSGAWPNCQVVLTRKSNAPGCQSHC